MHVWVAPAGDDQRSTAKDLLLDLAGALLDRAAELGYEESGRPYVDGLAVSISHSLRLVAVAASAIGPVGVDVEDVYQREVSGLARRWFDPSELSQPLPEPGYGRFALRRVPVAEIADPIHPPRLLGLTGERHGEGTGQRGQQEAAAVHHSIT